MYDTVNMLKVSLEIASSYEICSYSLSQKMLLKYVRIKIKPEIKYTVAFQQECVYPETDITLKLYIIHARS